MLGTCLVPSLLAQEREVKQPKPADMGVINDIDVTVTDLTEEKLNNPPKREINVERVDEPLKQKLPKADPKLFEQKYVAILKLETRKNGQSYVLNSALDGSSAPNQFIGEYPLIHPHTGYSNYSKLSPSECLQQMVKFLPAGKPIAKEELDFLADPQTFEGMLSFKIIQGRQQDFANVWSFLVLGATPEEAERRAKAFLTLLDQGAFRPIQLALLRTREPLCVQLRDQRKLAEAAPRLKDMVQKELTAFVDFTPDMLPNLRVQQLQLDVELAGVKARIATCEKLLAQPALKTDRRNQIEDLKVAAEIEFSGFEARRTKSEEFVGKVKTKINLLSKLSAAERQLTVAGRSTHNLEVAIRNLDATIRAYTPLPLVDNKIVLKPLEWTQ